MRQRYVKSEWQKYIDPIPPHQPVYPLVEAAIVRLERMIQYT